MTEPGDARPGESDRRPEIPAAEGCVGWALWYVASGFFVITGGSLLVGAFDTNIVVVGIGLVALIPGVMIGRPALRRVRAVWAAERRVDEWTARQRRAAVIATTGLVVGLGYLLIAAPLFGVIVVVGTLLVLLPFIPHIRRQIRWYRNLVKP